MVDSSSNWQRVGNLGYLNLANAGAEIADPMRVARTYLRQVCGFGKPRVGRLVAGVRSLHQTSSIGRLFDAVAAMTNACRVATFDGQAPIALESLANPLEDGNWFSDDLLDLTVSPALLRPEPLLAKVARDTARGAAPAAVAARFHNTLSQATIRLADFLCARAGIATVCLSGGSFQNSLLRRRVTAGLRSRGRKVYGNRLVPTNDGGIAYGQAAACACAQSRFSGP